MSFSTFFPPSFERVASRAGRVSFVLAASVAFLFPDAAGAGTDTEAARWTTVAALAAGGALLVVAGRSWAIAGLGLAALAAGAVLAPAPWLLVFGAISCLYVATALVPRGTAESPRGEEVVAAPDAPPPDVASPDVALPDVAAVRAPAPAAAEEGPAHHEGRELVDSIAVALVLALVVREFAFEAFKIPTGSMEPTIHGDALPRSKESLLSDFVRLFQRGDPPPGRRGDRLLAFKGTFSDPERWQIVVFKFPLYRGTNYIKRLVGLPGERLEIRDGDIYAGRDGAAPTIVAKPDSVQETMWRHAFSARSPLDADFDEGWSLDGSGARLDATLGPPEWLVLRQDFGNDFRGSFDVRGLDLVDGGALLVRIEGGDRRVTLEVTRDAMRVTAPGRDRVELGVGGAARLGKDFRLGLSYADRIVRVHAGGRQVARMETDRVVSVYADSRQVARMETADAPNAAGSDSGRFSVGGAGAKAVLSDFVVETDVQYSTPHGGLDAFDIPDDGFVMFGDNTDSSRDSRLWRAHVVTTKDGRSFVAPNEARLDDDRDVQTWHPRGDGGVEFVDADGVQHDFPKHDIERIETSVHQPYVRRRDIVGPAFLVFFPFPPFGEFRPRFLR